MPGRAEAEDAEMFSLPRHDKRAPADQACAKQRCNRDVVAGFAERKAIAGVRDEMRGKAAVAGIASEARTVAQILLTASAIEAFAAGVAEPGNADPFAYLQVADTSAQRVHPADHLMAGNDRIGDFGQFTVHHMQIGTAHAAGTDPDAHVARPGCRILPRFKPERRSGRRQDHGVHLG